MAFNEFPFLRYVIFFMIGILIYPWIEPQLFLWVVLMFVCLYLLYLLLILHTVNLPVFKYRYLVTSLAFSIWILSGYIAAHLKDVKNDFHHLLYKGEIDAYIGTVQENDEAKSKSVGNLIKVSRIRKVGKWEPATGKVIIYHQSKLVPGQLILFEGSPDRVIPPANPQEFDYAKFLSRQQIYHTHLVGNKLEILGSVSEQPLHFFFIEIREFIQDGMDHYIHDKKALQIVKALLLGQKSTLDKEVSEAYSTAGAMHVLAVSGLHVGIIYGMFFLFLKPFSLNNPKRVAYLFLVIIIIWIYALLTGMSPSVMRSATMFTIVSLAQMKSRNPSIFNGLALSAVLLLLYDPFLIYAVGFQLSYAALTGIVLFQPLILNLWLPRNRVANYLWEITAVSIAAQVATFPLSAYYFYSFPAYFILSNLIAIPGAFLIMMIGIPFMIFSFIGPMASGLGTVLDYTVQVVNSGIFLIQALPSAKISFIHIETWEIVWYYMLLMLIFWIIMKPHKRLVIAIMGGIFLGSLWNWSQLLQQHSRHEIFLYTTPGGRVIDYYKNSTLFTWDAQISREDITFKVLPNRISQNVKTIDGFPIQNIADEGVLILPDKKIITIHDQILSFDNLKIKEVAKYEASRWVKCRRADIRWNDNTAYRIILE